MIGVVGGGRLGYLTSPEPVLPKRYHVQLTPDDRQQLEQLVSRGKTSARVITRARILLKAADGANDEQIVDAAGNQSRDGRAGPQTVRVRGTRCGAPSQATTRSSPYPVVDAGETAPGHSAYFR